MGNIRRNKFTFKVAGTENLSITTSSTPSFLLSCTIKYLGSRRSKAAILPGSRVRVAENRSFWHDEAFDSVGKTGISGYGRMCKNAGATASDGTIEEPGDERFSVRVDGRVAART